MQGVTRNPLADPGLLGVSSGAALFVVVGITAFGLSSATGYLAVAVAGSAVAASFVYAVGSLAAAAPPRSSSPSRAPRRPPRSPRSSARSCCPGSTS